MSDYDTEQADQYDAGEDQDSEPTMTAPEEGRPDGITPHTTDAEMLEAQEEEGPADE
jgi:hypothetical protein